MHFGKWEMIRTLGQGGQGVVYLVRDTSLSRDDRSTYDAVGSAVSGIAGAGLTKEQREAHTRRLLAGIAKHLQSSEEANCSALKKIKSEILNNENAFSRFKREVEILRKSTHPHLIQLVDSKLDEGWFVTPFYAQGPLSKNLHRYAGDPLEALKAFRPLVTAVASLHDSDIVHRDIKPENIFVAGDRLILGDLGIAHFQDDEATRMTETYENVGSRDWMPGWAMGIRLDDVIPTFDVFGLGKVLWAMVSGRTRLQLWYYNRPQYDLRNQFPNDPAMHWINRILQHCVVENEDQCMRSARELLDNVDKIIAILKRGGQITGLQVPRKCLVCAYGLYQLIADWERNSVAVHNLGLNPGMKLRVFRCGNCGHLEVFQMQPNPIAWGESPS